MAIATFKVLTLLSETTLKGRGSGMRPSISKLLIVMTIGVGGIAACSDSTTPKRYDRNTAGAIETNSGNVQRGTTPQANIQLSGLISPDYDASSCSASNKKCINYMQVNATPSAGTSCVPTSKKISMSSSFLSFPFGEVLNASCSYAVQVDLGYQDLSSTTGLFTSYFTNSGNVIQSSQLAASVQGTPVTLQVSSFTKTANGSAIGLPEFSSILESASVPSTPGTPSTPSTPSTPTDPGTPTTPSPETPQGNLFSGFATITLTDSSGATSTMDKHVKGKYLFLDFSGGTGCGYCVELANEINKNSSLSSAISAGKCSAITVLNVSGSYGSYSQWMSKYKGTPTGDHSYSVSNLNTVAKVFGKSVNGYPTVYVIDTATGKAVSSSRDTNSFVSNYCK